MGELPLFLLPNNDRPMKRPLFLMLFFAATAITLAQPDGHSHGVFDTFVTDTPMVHDPVMAFENGRYYLFSTGHGIRLLTAYRLGQEIPYPASPSMSGHPILSVGTAVGGWLIRAPLSGKTHRPSV